MISPKNSVFRILFVGQFIERKRLDLLIAAVADIDNPYIVLAVVGSGPVEQYLRQNAESLLPARLDWIGRLSMNEVRQQMKRADCVVLPSRHDGWGAVVSEALMAGTPVICSDGCGASQVVRASGVGGIFSSGHKDDLKNLLELAIMEGKPSDDQREKLAHWACSLGGASGADYFLNILNSRRKGESYPPPPWE